MRRRSVIGAGENGGRLAGGCSPGFTLLELLVVMAIVVMLSTLVIPSVVGLSGAFAVTRQGQNLHDQFVLARQTATTRNRDVELRLLESGTAADRAWTIQLWELAKGTSPAAALGAKMRFDDRIVLNPDLSPMLEVMTTGTAANEVWHALRFRPNGRLNGQFTAANNYVTLQLRHADPVKPDNFFTIQVHPITGRISVFRP